MLIPAFDLRMLTFRSSSSDLLASAMLLLLPRRRGSRSAPPLRLADDAHVVVEGELVAVEHGRPGEAVVGHGPLAARLHLLAERPARVDRPLEADRREQGAEEELAVLVALDVEEGHPAGRLLAHLVHGVVVEQVRQAHLGVADVLCVRIWPVKSSRRKFEVCICINYYES